MNYLTRKLTSIVTPIVTSILQEEIKKRVDKLVDTKLKEVFSDMSQPKEIAVVKSKNKPLGDLLDFIATSSIDITELELSITGQSEIETFVFYKAKFKKDHPIKEFVTNVTNLKITELETVLLSKGFVTYTDLDVRVRFDYMGNASSKNFSIIDTTTNKPTDYESVATQIRRVRDEIIRLLPEHLI